jgi:hypothetical protein
MVNEHRNALIDLNVAKEPVDKALQQYQHQEAIHTQGRLPIKETKFLGGIFENGVNTLCL